MTADVDKLVEQANETIDETGCNTSLLTVEESIDFYEGIVVHARGWIETLKNEA